MVETRRERQHKVRMKAWTAAGERIEAERDERHRKAMDLISKSPDSVAIKLIYDEIVACTEHVRDTYKDQEDGVFDDSTCDRLQDAIDLRANRLVHLKNEMIAAHPGLADLPVPYIPELSSDEDDEEDKDEELQSALDEAIRALLASIGDAEGLNTLMMTLIGWYVALLSG